MQMQRITLTRFKSTTLIKRSLFQTALVLVLICFSCIFARLQGIQA